MEASNILVSQRNEESIDFKMMFFLLSSLFWIIVLFLRPLNIIPTKKGNCTELVLYLKSCLNCISFLSCDPKSTKSKFLKNDSNNLKFSHINTKSKIN